MAKIRVRMSSVGSKQLLNSAAMVADMDRRARAVKAAADATLPADSVGYKGDGQPGKTRARGLVGTTDITTRRHNAKHQALLKALNSGR